MLKIIFKISPEVTIVVNVVKSFTVCILFFSFSKIPIILNSVLHVLTLDTIRLNIYLYILSKSIEIASLAC